MRTAIIADIHGNDVAFEAVLDEIQRAEVDQIVCLGDVAAQGPQPHECLFRLRAVGCPVVLGNGDSDLLNPSWPESSDPRALKLTAISRWVIEQLSPDDWDFLRTFQPVVRLPIGDRETLFCFHGSPRSNTDYILPTAPEAEIEPLLRGIPEHLLAGGHTHIQMVREVAGHVLINPGSIGFPWDPSRLPTRAPLHSRAEFALLDWRDGDYRIEVQQVPIDVDALTRAVHASGMPHADWWLGDWA